MHYRRNGFNFKYIIIAGLFSERIYYNHKVLLVYMHVFKPFADATTENTIHITKAGLHFFYYANETSCITQLPCTCIHACVQSGCDLTTWPHLPNSGSGLIGVAIEVIDSGVAHE